MLPKRSVSRATGLLARTPLPPPLRPVVLGWYARRYGVRLDEMEGRLEDYRSLREFFQRPLRRGTRPIADGAGFCWPCDGRIVSSGPIQGDRISQVKGVDYTLEELLEDPQLARELACGSHATIYLAPGDYHRVHAPFAARLLTHRHLRGGLFPVNQAAVRSVPKLFARNERDVLRCRLEDGRPAALVLVAALNVSATEIHRPLPRDVGKGEEVGRFGMGSTVVAIAAPGRPSFADRPPGAPARMGENAS